MRGKNIALSIPRRFIGDWLHFARQLPTVPVQRRMNLTALADELARRPVRPEWITLFAKAYSIVVNEYPELRRAYVKFPWPHLSENGDCTASVAVERSYQGEQAVFIGCIANPATLSIDELERTLRFFHEAPIEQIEDFQGSIGMTRLPRTLRRSLWWWRLNLARWRTKRFADFVIADYSRLGAESLHPLSPLTTTLNFGVMEANGCVDVRIVYDHRVLDGATVARALCRLEKVLVENVAAELRALPLAA